MTTVTLPRFPANWQEQPHLVSRYWDEAMLELEKTLNAVLAIPAIEEALLTLDETIAAAVEATEELRETSTTLTKEQSLLTSYVEENSFVSPLISADASGDITVATHNRVYGNSVLNPTVEVLGDTFSTGASPGDVVRVYYFDDSFTGGSVTYLYTVDPDSPVAQGAGNHSVGAVTIPASGSLAGNYIRPSGYVQV